MYNSSFFADTDPTSGIGGWGNPAADFEVQEGALAGFRVEYPYPHLLRRNFTLRPYSDDRQRMANSTFTREKIAKLVESYTGDYRGFQIDLESMRTVRSLSPWFFLVVISFFV